MGLIATTGTIGETGAITAGTSVRAVLRAPPVSTVPTVIAALGNFSANDFTLADGTNLTITGAVNGGPFGQLDVAGI